MGLRTTSSRRPHVAVMAPALTTDSARQPQNFDLGPPKAAQLTILRAQFDATGADLNGLALASEQLVLGKPPPYDDINMTDEHAGIGLHRKSPTRSRPGDMEQLLHSLASALPEADKMDELMGAIAITGADLTNNLTSLEKELLEDADVVNMALGDQAEDPDTADQRKESQAEEFLAELKRKHAKVERRLDFLRRRIFKLQARYTGQHVASEMAGVFENVHRTLKRSPDGSKSDTMPGLGSQASLAPDKPKPISYGAAKTLARRLEISAIMQANGMLRQRHGSRYFGLGSMEAPFLQRNVAGMVSLPNWPRESKQELQKVAGQLQTQLGLVQDEVDSEATESSSGGESCDEMQTYTNPHQQYLSIQKRALWKYSAERAAIAGRWTWLQVQISDLEYRIRQHADLHRQVRGRKSAIRLSGADPPAAAAVNGYRGQLPGDGDRSPSKTADESADGGHECARTRPLLGTRKRKLLQLAGLHVVSKKAARPSTSRCTCACSAYPAPCCALCTGRTDPTHPRDPPDTLGKVEKVALVDSTFHPVFSLPEDISQKIHLDAIMKIPEWQQRSTRMKTPKSISKSERLDRLESKSEHRSEKLEHRNKYCRMLKPSTMSALSAKIKSKIRGRKAVRHSSLGRLHRKRRSSKDSLGQPSSLLGAALSLDEEMESLGNGGSRSLMGSPSFSPLLPMQSVSGYGRRNRVHSYDIDNIVIPYSVAASTRVEKLQYKEIQTPKWRIAYCNSTEVKIAPKNNGAVKKASQADDGSIENDLDEDLSEESVIARHDRCELEEKRRFLSYLKPPIGCGRVRSHKRTDSQAESSGGNTPDPMSPHAVEMHQDQQAGCSPLASPPATPVSVESDPSASLTTLSRRRTTSQGYRPPAKDKEATVVKEERIEAQARCVTPVKVAPFESRTFPIDDETFEKMLKVMPENHHQFKTNERAQDACALDRKPASPVNSESTESVIGEEGEEDPNDPEWIEAPEKSGRERFKR